MEIPRSLKIGTIVLSGLAFAFLLGYVIFSYFSRDTQPSQETAQTAARNQIQVEEDSEGISPVNGSVAGATDFGDSEGISATAGKEDSSANSQKGGVLGETKTNNSQDGIAPNNAAPQKNIITKEDREDYKRKSRNNEIDEDEDTSDSEVFLLGNPLIEEKDDYIQYTYTFEFNGDAKKRYKDGFKYSIDEQSCDDDDYFTSSGYDFSGTIDSGDIDGEIKIKVRIKDDFIDDASDLEDSEYKLEGTKYIVEGDIQVPQCED